jgi:hypothetical protein
LHFGAEVGTHDPHAAWRYTLMSGLIPAIPLIVIRPFLPESPVWAEKRAAGTLRRPSLGELFSPALRRTTIVTTIMFACSLGAAFGAIQQMPQIVPGLPEVQQEVRMKVSLLPQTRPATRPATGPATAPANAATTAPTGAPIPAPLSPPAPRPGGPGAPDPRVAQTSAKVVQEVAANVAFVQEMGGLVGRILLALLVVYIVSRRALIRIFQVPGLLIIPFVFAYASTHSLGMLKVGMFAAGLVTVAQLSFWGNYLPRVYPVHLRGTGESFAANIGGRMIGTSFAAVTAWVAAALTPKGASLIEAAHHWAYAAAGVGFAVYLIGFLASFFLPEPGAEHEQD